MARNIYGRPVNGEYGDEYDRYHSHHLHGLPNEPVADETTDQLPLFSQVGRGISGDSYKVEISSDSDNATYLTGSRFDAALKQWVAEWESENINGGHLSYSYQYYDDLTTPAFTITFTYTRPGRIEWEWTTPLIPYIPDDTEHVVTLEKLSSVLSVPISQLEWLIDNKEADEGDASDTGIHNTEKDLLDWIDDNDEDLGKAINSETVARQDADASLSTAIENEATTRKSADDGLQTAIDNEATTRKSADDTLQKNIDAIKQCECDEEALKKEILDHIHNDLGFDLDSELTDGGGMTVKEYIDSVATSVITNEITNNITNYIYGEKLTCFIKEDFTIDAKKTGWAGQYIPLSSSKDDMVGGSDRLYVTDDSDGDPTVCVLNTSSSVMHILVAGQIAAQTEDDAYGISFGIHQRTGYNTYRASSDDPYIDIAQAQAIGEANSQSYITALTTPIVCEVPAKTACYFDLTARPISSDETTGKCIITSIQTRTYLTITII